MNRSPKVIEKALIAGFHRIIHRALPRPVGSSDLVTRYRHSGAAASLGKWPRALIARRNRAFRLSLLLVVASTRRTSMS